MSIQEMLQKKLLESVTKYGVITGVEVWEKEINDLKNEVMNDYLEKIIMTIARRNIRIK